jgi:hypothetical protein
MASENTRRHRTIAFRQKLHKKLPILAAEADGERPDLVAAERYVSLASWPIDPNCGRVAGFHRADA